MDGAPPSNYAKCLAGVIIISSIRYCHLQPNIVSYVNTHTMPSTNTQIGLPVTTLVMKIGLPEMVYPQICPGIVFSFSYSVRCYYRSTR